MLIPIFLENKVAFLNYKKKVHCVIGETWSICLATRASWVFTKQSFTPSKIPIATYFVAKTDYATWRCRLTCIKSNSLASCWATSTHRILTIHLRGGHAVTFRNDVPHFHPHLQIFLSSKLSVTLRRIQLENKTLKM